MKDKKAINPFNPDYYDEGELREAGFKSLGSNIKLAKNCTIIGLENICIGSNVRIDGYCTLVAAGDGFLNIGSYVHIGGYSLLLAGAGITLEDFSGLSQGVKLYSKTDDYSGSYLTNPTVPVEYTGVVSGEVRSNRHVIVGSSSVVLPGVSIGEGSSIGAMSLVTKNLEPWGVYFGTPVNRLKSRSKKLLDFESELLDKKSDDRSR